MKKSELEIAAEWLAGTCKSISEVVDSDISEDSLAEHLAEIEQFCCDTCGWWSYPGEELEGNCTSCEEEICD